MLDNKQMYGRPIKSLGQNFLKNESIAEAEAVHGHGKRVLELGPGYGVLTKLLCKQAKSVVAVEKDANLYRFLKSEITSKKLKLINKDFFKATDEELGADQIEIMISNVPYNLSSKVIDWLLSHSMQAVLCLQKEFVEHMRAKCDTDNYTRLSVMTELCFSMTKIMDVPRGNFFPIPKVDSAIIYIKPKSTMVVTQRQREILSLLMQHKKKRLRNALIDSHSYLKMEKSQILKSVESLGKELNERTFKRNPYELLEITKKIEKALQKE